VREELNELAEEQDRAKISFNDLITKASALALRDHPYVNASYLPDEGEIRKYNRIHIGIAVAIDEGLITPVIRDADQKGLTTLARETRELAERARNRDLEPEEFEGATFTTSNLGMFGIEEFTAIINPPNSAILAIGEIRDTPVVEDGEVVPGKRMKVTLSCDHRVVDGAVGARFLDSVRTYLEDPMNLLL
jgi:pyruvate dehydrogenase E2 component (dihydrolipoamide acetyltransferase)